MSRETKDSERRERIEEALNYVIINNNWFSNWNIELIIDKII